MTISSKAAIWYCIAAPDTWRTLEEWAFVTITNLSKCILQLWDPCLHPAKHQKHILNFNHTNSSVNSLELLTISQPAQATSLIERSFCRTGPKLLRNKWPAGFSVKSSLTKNCSAATTRLHFNTLQKNKRKPTHFFIKKKNPSISMHKFQLKYSE